ncbi:uncharacterized protein Pyn_17425 [Prunus yedoensis var. nudiflora]|uniref:U1-type domain-containing protein n=1 Tax=Prunus yedoensis var. nudiflora TaxID=2094558 RepID=A0A315AE64_PRUYE|nr:uncharacterized protein Pyn_17425 [Prunus yedoensis var. nudiflora]
MGFVGLLGISLLQCFDVLAWPLLALVYPLYCSIKAIETNSISDNQKLNTYWVVFSLILLFQNAFLKFLEWLPLWPYIRIMIVFWLVMPHFDGAFYVYKHLVCPCLTMDSQIVTNWFNERRKELLFRAEGERYVKENVPEALETIACKVSQAGPNLTGTENSKSGTTVDSNLDCQKHKAAYDALKIKSQAEPMLTQIESSTFAAMKTKVKAVAVTTGGEVLESCEEVQKEWTRALCEVTTPSEATFDPELEGRKLKVIINEKVQAHEVTIPASVTATSDESKEKPAEGRSSDRLERNFKENVQGQQQNPNEVLRMKGSRLWCNICRVGCCGEIDLLSHLNGRKHKENVQEQQQQDANEAPRKNDPPLWCNICRVRCSEINMASHLNGRKHKENVQEPQNPRKNEPPLCCKICSVGCSGKIHLASHLNGKKHKDKVQEQQQNADIVQWKNDPPLWCKVCDVSCYTQLDMASLNRRKHWERLTTRMQVVER